MHDFLLAKEIIDELKKIAQEKGLDKVYPHTKNALFKPQKNHDNFGVGVKSVSIEIGSISLAHDGHPEHTEDISLSNLEFGLKSIAKGTVFENTNFKMKKVNGDNWKITDIEVE